MKILIPLMAVIALGCATGGAPADIVAKCEAEVGPDYFMERVRPGVYTCVRVVKG